MDYGAKKGPGAHGRAYDNGKAITHFYQHDQNSPEHRGIGKINWYEATEIDKLTKRRMTRAEVEFGVYKDESKVKIYNVSPDSRIPTFPKINYDQFFSMLNDQEYNQGVLRKEVNDKVLKLKKDNNI